MAGGEYEPRRDSSYRRCLTHDSSSRFAGPTGNGSSIRAIGWLDTPFGVVLAFRAADRAVR